MSSIFGFTAKTDGVDDHLAAHVNSLQGAVDVLSGGIQNQMWNGKLDVSVSSSAITVAIKTLAGGNPSASDPVIFRIGNTLRILEAALSVTKVPGTNWFNSGSAQLATFEIDYFAYIIWDTVPVTDELDIGFARIPYGNNTADFSNTTTNEKHIATSNGSGLTVNNECEVIGRFNAILSATASFNWSLPATSVIINRPMYNTRWLTWAPAPQGFSAVPTSTVYQYKIFYDTFDFIYYEGTAGTSNATTFTATAAFAPLSTGADGVYPLGVTQDNSVLQTTPGRLVMTAGSNAMTFREDTANGAWTNANAKRAGVVSGYYRI